MSARDETAETGAALAAALAATRRAFDGQSERALETERRILDSMGGTKRTRRIFWLVPLAAAFLVSGAFAQEIGERLSDIGSSWFAGGDAVDAVPSSRASAPTRAAPAPEPPAEPQPAEPVARAPAPSSLARHEPPAPIPVRPVPSASAPQPEAASELAIYKEAHRAHFVEQDFSRALAGWDRYLAVAPRGTFALEARYNRAIALHRLGRRSAALEALRPFADGVYGRYRRDEAQELVEELR